MTTLGQILPVMVAGYFIDMLTDNNISRINKGVVSHEQERLVKNTYMSLRDLTKRVKKESIRPLPGKVIIAAKRRNSIIATPDTMDRPFESLTVWRASNLAKEKGIREGYEVYVQPQLLGAKFAYFEEEKDEHGKVLYETIYLSIPMDYIDFDFEFVDEEA